MLIESSVSLNYFLCELIYIYSDDLQIRICILEINYNRQTSDYLWTIKNCADLQLDYS